jgi:hypothetical protein
MNIPDVHKIARDMAIDEREIFLSLYNELQAKAIEKALQQTAVKLAKSRKEKAQAARARIPEIAAELKMLDEAFADWHRDNYGVFINEEMGRNRGRVQSLLQEREKLKSIIQQGDIK